MNYRNSSSPPPDFVLLQSIHDDTEIQFLCGLLESHGIEAHVEKRNILPDNPETKAVARFDIFVKAEDVNEARSLIEVCNREYTADDDVKELKEFQEERKNKSQRANKIMPMIVSAIFFGLANLPMKESAREFQYVLIGISLFFFLLFIFSLSKVKVK